MLIKDVSLSLSLKATRWLQPLQIQNLEFRGAAKLTEKALHKDSLLRMIS